MRILLKNGKEYIIKKIEVGRGKGDFDVYDIKIAFFLYKIVIFRCIVDSEVIYVQISLKRRSFSELDGVTIPVQWRSHFGRTTLPPDKGLSCS